MYATINDVKVDSVIMFEKNGKKFSRSLTDSVAALAGKIWIVVPTDAGWYELKNEDDKFILHESWITLDERIDSKVPPKIEIEKPYPCVIPAGLLNDGNIYQIQQEVERFNKRKSDFSAEIKWPSLIKLAENNFDWNISSKGKKAIEQRYLEFTLKRYGVQVPDALYMKIGELAKFYATRQRNVEIIIRMGLNENHGGLEDNLFHDKNGLRCGINNTKGMSVWLQPENLFAGMIVPRGGWWLVISDGHELPLTLANVLVSAIGKDTYSIQRIKSNVDANMLCIFRKEERGPVETEKYDFRFGLNTQYCRRCSKPIDNGKETICINCREKSVK
jgi:hypothetical protein